MSWKALSCSFALWITLASLGNAYSTISLNPSKENTLIQTTNPNAQVSNALGDLYVGETAQSSIRRGLIEFDIADHIPATATITGGTLTMTDVQGLNGNQALTLQATLQNWGAGTSYSSGAAGDGCHQRRRHLALRVLQCRHAVEQHLLGDLAGWKFQSDGQCIGGQRRHRIRRLSGRLVESTNDQRPPKLGQWFPAELRLDDFGK